MNAAAEELPATDFKRPIPSSRWKFAASLDCSPLRSASKPFATMPPGPATKCPIPIRNGRQPPRCRRRAATFTAGECATTPRNTTRRNGPGRLSRSIWPRFARLPWRSRLLGLSDVYNSVRPDAQRFDENIPVAKAIPVTREDKGEAPAAPDGQPQSAPATPAAVPVTDAQATPVGPEPEVRRAEAVKPLDTHFDAPAISAPTPEPINF